MTSQSSVLQDGLSTELPGPVTKRPGGNRPARSLGRHSVLRVQLRTALPLIVAIVGLSIYTNSRNSAFLTWSNFDNILSQVSVLGILAAGQTLLVIAGRMDLSVGSMVSLVGVVAAALLNKSWGAAPTIVVCLAIGAGSGLLWGLIVANLKVPPFILTLGGLSVFASLALVVSHNTPQSVADGFSDLGFGTWAGLRAPAIAMIGVLLLTGFLLHFTRFGRDIYALGSSEQASFLAGLPVKRMTVILFTLNGLIVAFAGLVMLSRLASGDPRAGSGLELNAIAVTVLGGTSLIGGRGTMFGTFLGIMLFGVVDASLTFLQVPGAYQDLVSGGILVFAVVVTAATDLRAGRVRGGGGIGAALAATLTRVASGRPPRSETSAAD